MARPQSVPDEKIIAEAYRILLELGPSQLTFERLGARVGLVPAAIVRRFKTKRHLVLEADRYALERTNQKVSEAMAKAASPLDAIVAQFVTELDFATDIERFANGQEYLLMDLRDPSLYTNYQASFAHRHQQIAKLLRAAQNRGELDKIADIKELARHLQMILHGAGHVWAMTQQGPIEDYISHHVRLALAPYCKTVS